MARNIFDLDNIGSSLGFQNSTMNGLRGFAAVNNALSGLADDRFKEEQRQDYRNLKNALQGVDLSTDEGMGIAVNKASQVNPLFGLKLRQELTKGNMEERKAKHEALSKILEFNKAAMKNVGGDFGAYQRLFYMMPPEIQASMANPQQFVTNGQVNQNAWMDYYNRVQHGTQMIEAALKPPPKPETIQSGESNITRQWNPITKKYDIVATAPRVAQGEETSPFQGMVRSARAGDKSGFQFYYKLWQDSHGGKTPQVFKTKDNQFVWVTPGEPIPQGASPANQDLFKLMMGGMIGNLGLPNVNTPLPEATPAPQQSSGFKPGTYRKKDGTLVYITTKDEFDRLSQ